ncbi:MAG: 23S rRNA (guanosine(2251)-2'-O)-methyltransferase RlmB [Gammaproteobacteria bacterium]|nr:23S rRNA (guanosine(2251)-2'-O)-methyltransferase RlmB [Gammaproteobacteria bacterium]
MAKASRPLIYGLHAVEAALRNDPKNVVQLSVDVARSDQRLQKIRALADSLQVAVVSCSKRELDRFGNPNHQGVVAEYRTVQMRGEGELFELIQALEEDALVLVLDGIQDPHNLGACLRSADAVGAHAVVVPKDRAVGITPVVRKVAAGAVESVPFFQVTNISRTLKTLQDLDLWVVGLAGEAEQNLYDVQLKGAVALVMGSESSGMRRLTRDGCDQLVKIPMQGQVESLNVSVATGITLFEVKRQQNSGSLE